MATNMLANVLITAVISNGFPAAASPVVPAKPQHPTGIEVMLEVKVTFEGHVVMLHLQKAKLWEEPALLIFLMDASCYMTDHAEVCRKQNYHLPEQLLAVFPLCISPYAKAYGKKVETEGVIEGPSDPPYELSKGLLEVSPLHGKNFWKPSLPTSWKIKRACFWKYCVERK